MPTLQTHYIKSPSAHHWKWPVQFGFLKQLNDSEDIQDFRAFHWLHRLSFVYTLSHARSSCNVLILKGSPKKILKTISKVPFSIQTDLLVLCIPRNTKKSNHRQGLKQLISILKPNGIYITLQKKEASLLSWANELIFQLSHNNSLSQAIERADWGGYLAISKALNEGSLLSKVFTKQLQDLEVNTGTADYNLKEIFTDRIRGDIAHYSNRAFDLTEKAGQYRAKELLQWVRKSSEHFQYEHESDEASIVAEIAKETNVQTSDLIEKIGADKGEKTTSTGAARYLQCLIESSDHKACHHALVVDTGYLLKVKIDQPDKVWLQGGDVSDVDVPQGKGETEMIMIVIKYDDKTENQKIYLANTGSSTDAVFDILSNNTGEKKINVYAFHRSRLFQHIALSVYFCDSSDESKSYPATSIELVSMPKRLLNDLHLREEYGLSIVMDSDQENGSMLLSHDSDLREYKKEDNLGRFMSSIKNKIEAYLRSPSDYPSDLMAPENSALILSLAKKGSQLYKNYFHDISDITKPIQIISDSTSHIPIEFIYTKKITAKTKSICPKAREALKVGSCQNCNDENGQYICPFGFLCMSTVIERHDIGVHVEKLKRGDFGLTHEPSLGRSSLPLLQQTIFGTGETIEAHTADLRESVAETIRNSSGQATEVEKWDDWQKQVNDSNPDSLVIIGHVEPEQGENLERLQIGGDLLEVCFIDESYVVGKSQENKPFVVLIGCSTQNMNSSFMDFTRNFKTSGASIVLSTFTKIRGRHAGPLVQKLFEHLKSYKGKEISFGEVMLRLRQQLFSEGILVSMSLVAHGDADWTIKI